MKTGSVLDVPHSCRQKTGDPWLTLMQLDQQYWNSKEVYLWTFSRTQSEEITKSAQHFAKRFEEVPLQDVNKTKHQGSQQEARITFFNLTSDQIEQKPAFVNNIWFTDEACFHLSGYVNKVVITRRLTTGCNFHPVVSEVIKIFSLPLANVHT